MFQKLLNLFGLSKQLSRKDWDDLVDSPKSVAGIRVELEKNGVIK